MLARDPQNRPKDAELWPHFKDISPKQCRDCDPRHQDVWTPTAEQEAAANEDLDKRRSRVGDKSRCTPILAKPYQGVQRLLSPTLGWGVLLGFKLSPK